RVVHPAEEPVPVGSSPEAPTLTAIFAHDEPSAAPQRRAVSDPMREAAHAAFKRGGGQAPFPTSVAAERYPAAPAVVSVTSGAGMSDWVVQLGAFDSAAIAREKWQQISSRQSRIGGLEKVFSEITVNGRVFHRLAIRGFGDRNMAAAACRSFNA